MHRLIPYIFLITFSFSSTAQNGDQDPVQSYTYSATTFLDNESFDSAFFYNQKELEIYLNSENWKKYIQALNRQSNIFLGMEKLDQAKRSCQLAIEFSLQHLDNNSVELAEAYSKLGNVFYEENDDIKALEYQKKAIEVYHMIRSADSVKVSDAYYAMGKIHKRSQNLEEAISYAEKSASLLTSHYGEMDRHIIEPYDLLGRIHLVRGDNFMAIDYFQKTHEVRLKVYPDTASSTFAISYDQLGQAYSQIGEVEKGLLYHEKAVRISEKTLPKDDPSLAAMYGNLSHGYTQNGKYEQALDYALEDMRITTKVSENHPDLGIIYDNIGLVYQYKEEYDQALYYHQKALDFGLKHLPENHPGLGASYTNLGAVKSAQKDYQSAFVNFEKALHVYSTNYGKTHWTLSVIYTYLAIAHIELGEFDKSNEILFKALAVEKANFGKKSAFSASTYGFIGQCFKGLKDYERALTYFQKAFIANVIDFEDSLGTSNPDFENALNKGYLLTSLIQKAESLAQLYRETGDIKYLAQAQNTYSKSSQLIEEQLNSRKRNLDRSELGGRANRVYTGAIVSEFLRYQGNPDEAFLESMFFYMEKNKASILTLNLRDSRAKDFGNIPESLLDLEQFLLTKQSYLKSNIVRIRQSDSKDSSLLVTDQKLLSEINLRLDSLINAFETDYPAYFQLKYHSAIITPKRVRQKISTNQMLIEFAEDDSTFYILAISKDQFWMESCSKDSSYTNALAQFTSNFKAEGLEPGFSTQVSQFATSAHLLYEKLLRPIIRNTPKEVDHLILITPNSLSHIPWELFISESGEGADYKSLRYLLNDYSISYAHSATLLFQEGNENTTSGDLSVLAFAPAYSVEQEDNYLSLRSVFQDEVKPLQWTESEINEIDKLFPGKYLSGSMATEARFKENVGEYRILHLAMHAFVDDENPMQSKLVFFQDNDSIEDGMLHTHELFNMKIPAQMVVLSACKTGLGKIQKSEGIMSLGRAFSYAGCPSIVTSHWSVDDQSTSTLMGYFYESLAKGLSKSESLRQAKLKFLETVSPEKSHPFFWGSFVAIGDDSPVFTKSYGNYYIAIAFVLLIVIVIIYRCKTGLAGVS
ncbi:MAG: CHAT domain-containing protein [Cyclobacteriaceae bacterium]